MQGLLTHAALSTATKAVVTSGARASAAQAFRTGPPAKSLASKQALSHNARSFSAAAVAEAATPPEVTAVPASEQQPSSKTIDDQALQFKFIVPNGVVGAVVGRGGATVTEIKRQTGAYVQFTRPGTAVGNSRERMMILAVDDIEQENALDRLRTKGFTDKLFLQQIIPATCAGKVMGPGGEVIKKLSETSGCSVVVEGKPANAAFVPFRCVNFLASEPGPILAAVSQVLDLVTQEERYAEGIRELTSICFKIVEIPEKKVGALLGPAGAHIKSMQEVLRVKMGVADVSKKAGTRYVSLWGAPMNVKVALDVVLLATGLMQKQQFSEGTDSTPGTPRSTRSRSRSRSRAPSVAPSDNGAPAESTAEPAAEA